MEMLLQLLQVHKPEPGVAEGEGAAAGVGAAEAVPEPQPEPLPVQLHQQQQLKLCGMFNFIHGHVAGCHGCPAGDGASFRAALYGWMGSQTAFKV